MKVLFVIIFLFSGSLLAQSYIDACLVRNYTQSLSFAINNTNFVYYNSFGSSINHYHQSVQYKYTFKGQEFDSNLNLYLLPSRLYSAANKRFWQPDPKSQYFSPYCFVGSDPINYIDMDGKEGLALVLYEEDHAYLDGVHPDVLDLINEVKGAHYVPLSDFMNGKVGDLADWNGNVFIDAHVATYYAKEVELENSPVLERLKTKANEHYRYRDLKTNNIGVAGDARNIGSYLGRLSLQRGVKINNIFVGGCQGSDAARRIGEAFVETMPRKMNRDLLVTGVKPKEYLVYAGPFSTSAKDYCKGLNNTKLFFTNHPNEYKYKIEKIMEEDELPSFVSFYEKKGDEFGDELPYIEGKDLENMVVNSEVPRVIDQKFDSFLFTY